MNEHIGAFGIVRVQKRSILTGELVYDHMFKNTVQTFALQQAAKLWAGEVVATPDYIQLGTGSPPPGKSGTTPSDGGLWTPFDGTFKICDYAEVWLGTYTQYSVTYQQTEAIGTVDPVTNPTGQISITEAGLFDVNNNCWSHVALNGVTHDNTTTLSIQWQILQQGN